MSDSEPDVDDLLDEFKQQTRTNTEPETDDRDDDQDVVDLATAVAESLERIDDGDLHTNVTIRDENLAALFDALARTDRLTDVQRDAEAALGIEESNVSTASAARVLVRVGLQEVADDVLDDAKAGREQYVLNQESEF